MIAVLIIVGVVVLLLCWLLFLPIVLEIDSKLPGAILIWGSIAKANLWYEEEWWITIQLFFLNKKVRLVAIKRKPGKTKPVQPKIVRRNKMRILKKGLKVLETFRVADWKLSIDTGDYGLNGYLYPLNYLPNCYRHLNINFTEENYVYLRIKNRPWKMLYALLRETNF